MLYHPIQSELELSFSNWKGSLRVRNTIDSSRNAIDNSRSGIDSSRNGIDSNRNAIDSTRNAIDSTRNSIDCTRNEIDWNRNAIDWNRNTIDSSRNGIDSSRKATHCNQSGVTLPIPPNNILLFYPMRLYHYGITSLLATRLLFCSTRKKYSSCESTLKSNVA